MSVLVLGAALSGRAAAAQLQAQGDRVVLYDRDPAAVSGVAADSVHAGDWRPDLLDGVELVVVSPGIPEEAAPVVDALASGVPVWSELELGFRNLHVPVLAVTGTNGKTTVTELAAAMLTASGRRVAAVGNIGVPLSSVDDTDLDAVVVEASSFQLRFVDAFHAAAAVLLNVAPDHLDWHGTFERYVAAKRRILERQTAADVVIWDADDPGASAAVAGATARPLPVSGTRRPAGGAGIEGGSLRVGPAVIEVASLARGDATFVVDVAAAAAAALHLGADPGAVAEAAAGYRPPAHRRQLVGTWGGVAWVDDSKATNPHAALAAIRAYPSVVLIAGGRAKGLDIAPLAAEPAVRHVVAIGESAAALVAARSDTAIAGSMAEAVAAAAALARPGDTVLLAPGCASFDMFRSYSDRGEQFAAAVRAIKEV